MYEQPEHENEGYTEVFAWGSNRQKQLGVGQRGTQPLFPIPKLQSFGMALGGARSSIGKQKLSPRPTLAGRPLDAHRVHGVG